MSTVDPNAHNVETLQGLGLAIVATSIVCCIASFTIVGLRASIRLHEKIFGWDDALMVGGLTIFIVEVGLACTGAYHGLGTPSAELNDFMTVEATKYLIIWLLLYLCSLVMIKSSICVTMLRIASTNKVYRISISILLGITVATYLTTFVGVLLLCSPVEASWNPILVSHGKGRCASMETMVALSYTTTASSIATDLACAVIPGVILWRTQMKLSTKISVSALLSFGSLASISTMIRTPYIRFYLTPTDNLLYHVGNIVLWSNIETAIGLVAGSLPCLCRIVLNHIKKASPDNSVMNSVPFGLVTFGGSTPNVRKSPSRSFRNPTDGGISVTTIHAHGDGEWRRLKDDLGREESIKGIRADYSYHVELSNRQEGDSRVSQQQLKPCDRVSGLSLVH